MQRFLILLLGACLLLSSPVFAQSVQGTIVAEADDEVMIGASVYLKGTTQGTTTDTNGQFEVPVKSFPVTLIINYIGYQNKEVVVNSAKPIVIRLFDANIGIDEVVVTALGLERQSQALGYTVQ
ncbi:MAG: carboxypeptidase-like regulatory domain-containing protein, partial [Bacteroidota bacterium]